VLDKLLQVFLTGRQKKKKLFSTDEDCFIGAIDLKPPETLIILTCVVWKTFGYILTKEEEEVACFI